jgi:hypothetical protein
MASRGRLIVHIGTHKTATSTLQALMERERAALAARGLCYPRTDRPPYPQHPKHNSLHLALTAGPAAVAAERVILMREFDAARAHTLVLSAEGLSTLPAEAVTGMRAFAEDFDIEIVCFLRRPDRFLESLWNQRCKNGREPRHIDGFLSRPRIRAQLDYPAMLDSWAGVGRVTALGFETACASGLVQTFNAATGLDLPDDPRRRNVSPGMRCAAVMAGLNARGVSGDWRRIAAMLDGADTPHALGARLRARLLRDLAPGIDELARRYGVHFPDDTPAEPEDVLPQPTAADLDRVTALLTQDVTGP